MESTLEDVNHISIYTKGETERINEIALLQPLKRGAQLPSLAPRTLEPLSFPRQLTVKVQAFFFKHLSFLIPPERRTPEAKFKTILATLLQDEAACDYFLGSEEKQRNFYHASQKLAYHLGYQEFAPFEKQSPRKIARQLTSLPGQKESLVENSAELRLQLAALNPFEKNALSFRLLDALKRPPVTTIIEVGKGEGHLSLPMTTKYAKYKIEHWDKERGTVTYSFAADEATASIRTIETIRPGATGVINQREIIDGETKERIGTYGGELSNLEHLLEQILLILNQKSGQLLFLPDTTPAEETKILFISLYGWNELGSITEQHEAIHALNGKVIQLEEGHPIRLHLLHYNIALGKLPPPAEMGATIKDINDECLLRLLGHTVEGSDFFERQKKWIDAIDQFRKDRQKHIETLPTNSPLRPLIANQKLKGPDQLIYLKYVAQELGYEQNTNSTLRSQQGAALDKALHAYQSLQQRPYLPLSASDEERAFFQVIHHLYSTWATTQLH